MMTAVGFPDHKGKDLEKGFKGESDNLRVSVVKHPKRWLSKCFKAINDGVLIDLPPFTDLPTHSYDAFVRSYVHECPGAVSQAMHCEADTVLRSEDLPWALVELLVSLGMSDMVARLVLKVDTIGINYPLEQQLLHKLHDADSAFCDRYDYT